jgi:hypothetical protein
MPVTCGRFEQFYNARAAVVTGSLMVGERRGARLSDKNQVEPMPKRSKILPEEMGKGRKSAGGHWPFQRRECGSLRKGRRRADDRDGCPDFSSLYTQVRSSLGTQMTIRQRATRWTAVIPSG